MGHVHIDQNPIERCFRSGKVGLRNSLFVVHPAAGWRSAVIYSVVATCKLAGVRPESYLTWVLPILAVGTNRSTAQGFLPHDFAKLPTRNRSSTAHRHLRLNRKRPTIYW